MRTFIQEYLAQLILLLSMILPMSTQAQNIAISHCQGKCPQYESNLAATRGNIVVHNLYAAGLNNDTGLPDWVAYRLTKDAIGVASLLPRFWQPDDLQKFYRIDELAELEADGFSLAEISTAANPYGGFNEPASVKKERARLAPMTSFANTPYWLELNNLSNMVPMPAPLRRGAWLRLEQTLNQLAVSGKALRVISGPLFLINQPLNTASMGADSDPAAYFKVVVGSSGIAAFVFPKDLTQQERYCDLQGKLEQIELMSGLHLFPEVQLSESAQLLTELGCMP
jgi:endonuclease G, mitochondrial